MAYRPSANLQKLIYTTPSKSYERIVMKSALAIILTLLTAFGVKRGFRPVFITPILFMYTIFLLPCLIKCIW